MKNKNSLAFNATLNVAQQIISLLIPLISFPYVTRTIGTEKYGAVSFSLSIVGYFSLIAAFGVKGYAVRQGAKIRDNKELIRKFANEVYSINLISTAVSFCLLLIVLLLSKKLEPYLAIISILSINILFTTLGADWINTVYEDYLSLTIRFIFCQLLMLFLLLIFVRKPDDYLVYAFIINLGNVIASIFNRFYIKKKYNIPLCFGVHLNLGTHLRPLLFLFVGALSTSIYISSDMTIIGLFFDDKTVGTYAAAANLYGIVKGMLNAFIVVSIPRFSQNIGKKNVKNVQKDFEWILGIVLIIILPTIVGILFWGKTIVNFAVGSNYAEATSSFIVLGTALFFAVSSNLLVSVIMLSANMEKGMLLATTLSATINILLNFALVPKYGIIAAAYTTWISEMFMFIFGTVSVRKIVSFRFNKEILTALAGAVWISFCSYLLKVTMTSEYIGFLFSVISGIVYLGVVWIAYHNNRTEEAN